MRSFARIVAVIIFSSVAVFHLLRLTSHWEITLNGFTVPQWISIPGFLITATLAFMLWHESKK